MRRLLVLFVLIASVGLTACAGRGRVQPPPAVYPVQAPIVLKTPNCFDEVFLGDMPTEAFSNTCPVPVQGVLEEVRVFNGVVMTEREDRKTFCQFVLRPGSKKMGPAIWSYALDSEKDKGGVSRALVIHGDYIATVTNDSNTVAMTSRNTARLNTTSSQGVVKFTCPTGGGR